MKKRTIKHNGELDLAGYKIPCYVLEDGTRVLSKRGIQNSLKLTDQDSKYSSEDELIDFKPILCRDGNKKVYGYEATKLVDFLDKVLETRNQIKLSPQQRIVAKQCEILLRGFAKVGVIALVDEATGYQYERDKANLDKMLDACINTPAITLKQLQKELKEKRENKARQKELNSKSK